MVKLACPLCCGRYFNTREALKYHLSALTADICCPECCQSFVSIPELVNHLDGLCSEEYQSHSAPDPEEESELISSDLVTVVQGSVRPSGSSVVIVTADSAVDDAADVENYIPILDGFSTKEEPEAADEDDIADDVQYYYCSSCDCNIDSVIEHISTYHPNETVEYEGAELTLESDSAIAETVVPDNDDGESSHSQMEQNSTQSEKSPKEKAAKQGKLPRTSQELLSILEGNDTLREASSEELKFYNCKRNRFPRPYVEKIIENEDGNNVTIYTCGKCSREFQDMSTFKLHKCPFSIDLKKECPVCSEKFDSSSDFTAHFRGHHPTYKGQKVRYVAREFVRKMVKQPDSEIVVEGYSCTKCSREFCDEATAKRHKCKIPPHLHKECPICFKMLETNRNYTVHLRNHGLSMQPFPDAAPGEDDGKSNAFTCLKCTRGFDKKEYFELHKCDRRKAGKSVWECEVCDTKLSTKTGLNSHMRMHKPEEEKKAWKNKLKASGADKESDPLCDEVFICAQCGEQVPLYNREIHLKMHHGELFCCPLKSCNKNFASQELLDDHSQVHIEVQSQIVIFACFYCRQKFAERQLFLEHIKRHKTADRQHMCTFCGRGFQKPNERIKHEWIHTGHQPHVCLTCGMRFRKSFCLVTHERIHTGVRPYTCEVCGKTFRTRSAFTHHSKIHSDLRLFSCKFCPKTFKTAVQLCNHRNTHTKPFTCSLCSRRFINSYSMRRHTRKHSTYEHFCDICGAAYGRSFELRDHLIEAHGRSKSPLPTKRKNKKQEASDDYTYDA